MNVHAHVCCKCGRDTEAPVTVGYVERPSGPPFVRRACPDCAPWCMVGPSPEDMQHTLDPR